MPHLIFMTLKKGARILSQSSGGTTEPLYETSTVQLAPQEDNHTMTAVTLASRELAMVFFKTVSRASLTIARQNSLGSDASTQRMP